VQRQEYSRNSINRKIVHWKNHVLKYKANTLNHLTQTLNEWVSNCCLTPSGQCNFQLFPRIHLSCLRKWEVIIGVQGYSQRHDNFIGWGTAKVISISILLFCPRVGRGNIACYDHIIAVPLRLSASSKRGDRLGDQMDPCSICIINI
jgi:hypothetical protein